MAKVKLERTKITVSISVDVLEQMDVVCHEKQMTRTAFIQHLFKEYQQRELQIQALNSMPQLMEQVRAMAQQQVNQIAKGNEPTKK